jgi:hypothetical protein
MGKLIRYRAEIEESRERSRKVRDRIDARRKRLLDRMSVLHKTYDKYAEEIYRFDQTISALNGFISVMNEKNQDFIELNRSF